MQVYYFYHSTLDSSTVVVATTPLAEPFTLAFIWLDALREDVEHHVEIWAQQVMDYTGIQLNEYHLNDLMNQNHPSTFDLTDEYDLIIFRKLLVTQTNNQQQLSPIHLQTTPIGLILARQALVTIRHERTSSVDHFIQRFQSSCDQAQLQAYTALQRLPVSALDLGLRLLNTMIDKYLELRSPLTQRAEYWQQTLLQGSRRFNQWHQLLQENLALQQLQNLCEEQIDALQELRDNALDHLTLATNNHERQDILLVRINDLLEHIQRVQNHAIRLENSVKAAIDLRFSATANQTNENMRFLAIMTAVFAPLTLLTGVYGMNFDKIPGLHNVNGFWYMLAAMLLTTIILLIYFQKRHVVGRGNTSVTELLSEKRPDSK